MIPELLTTVIILLLLRFFWLFIIRVLFLKRFYENQGVEFIDNCFPVVGNEFQVLKLRPFNRSHDWLYSETSANLVGTIRGSQIQLYCTSSEVTQKLFEMTEKISRDSPAMYSFGRLSPEAIPFALYTDKFFKQRKAALMKGLNNTQRLYEIAHRNTKNLLSKHNLSDGSGATADLKQLLTTWTRNTSGEFIWGKIGTTREVQIINSELKVVSLPLMSALNEIDSELRFHSYKLLNRIYSPLVSLPISREARRLNHNVKIIRDEFMKMLYEAEDNSVAQTIVREGLKNGVPVSIIRDDLIIATSAGLDNVKSTIMSTIWYLFQAENSSWKQRLIQEIAPILSNPNSTSLDLARCRILDAVISEVLRLEPPGSLINNCVTTSFNLTVGPKTYRILKGTRIVPNIHVLHRRDPLWNKGDSMALNTFDPSRFLENGDSYVNSDFYMPFGKGARRCPGKWQGVITIKTFIALFLLSNPNCQISLPEDQTPESTHFNLLSLAGLQVYCGN